MSGFVLICWLLPLLYVQTVYSKHSPGKRILLGDPDVISSRLGNLEQENQELRHMLTQMNQLLTSLNNSNAALQSELTNLDTRVKLQDQVIETAKDHGSTYVRWGRTVCGGSSTEKVYSGYAAGQRYYNTDMTNYRGGAANMLCLPDDPQISNVSYTYTGTLLHGTEYEINEFKQGAANEDVPCALCRTPRSSVMIPGRQTCYNGWSLEYKGLLASGYRGYSASSYICMDGDPEFIPSGKADVNGQLLYVVGYKCGPLPCPPYEDQRMVHCVVCSK